MVVVEQVYQTGVKLSRAAMDKIEAVLQRLPDLRNWFVRIPCSSPAGDT
jgi:hypothetical protein